VTLRAAAHRRPRGTQIGFVVIIEDVQNLIEGPASQPLDILATAAAPVFDIAVSKLEDLLTGFDVYECLGWNFDKSCHVPHSYDHVPISEAHRRAVISIGPSVSARASPRAASSA
jgi:hypothetical protein